MTSSRLEPPTHTTGAHRAHRRPTRTSEQRPPSRYEPYLDGLFTYCLSVLCDHDSATELLGEVLAISERQYGRCPSGEAERKAWLYALARWACLRRLTEQRRKRQGAHTGRPAQPAVSEEAAPRVSEETAERRRRELALLAWPEAAGTTPEQREALELAVRHGLGACEVAAVLGTEALAARELLAAAACEVERTRAALAVVETSNCPAVARLTGDHRVLLSAALRRELVRHVDDCPRCRRAAERAGAGGPWPGSAVTPAALPLVEAPRAAAYVAMLHVPRARAGAPRFGPGGFPVDPKDHAARRDRLRARAVTTTVVAAVVAAPVLALWAAYRGAPLTGEGRKGASVTASEADTPAGLEREPYDHYANAGNARAEPDPRFAAGSRSADVSVEVISEGTSAPPPRPGQPGPGRLTVEAQPWGDTTRITLSASGGSPVTWSAWTDAPWLYVSHSSGTLSPGESVTIYVSVDHGREPAGAWSARVGVGPSGAVVEIDGFGATTPPPTPSDPTSTPTPTPPDPTPTPSDPTPSDPTPTPSDASTPPPSAS
ncbi:hypothetical protein OG883_00920 [Streptomyces sp. NBC_01142]|uniref:BACON domain-containing protein n=1 Tax=Streptomyces sp. NBC_01142 TaxID=2975865 RepID=UPI0022580071|nr:hypothetical protein [Streptomyces sp. NBC_01142]MCX4818493.1 hypothetical protein [Streptomyces sp. NBC_01142]